MCVLAEERTNEFIVYWRILLKNCFFVEYEVLLMATAFWENSIDLKNTKTPLSVPKIHNLGALNEPYMEERHDWRDPFCVRNVSNLTLEGEYIMSTKWNPNLWLGSEFRWSIWSTKAKHHFLGGLHPAVDSITRLKKNNSRCVSCNDAL